MNQENTRKTNVPNAPGIYVARILSTSPVPVTRDKRYADTCAKVDKGNVKIGKAKNFSLRQNNYWKDFDEENVVFIPLAILENITQAETAILRHLNIYRMRSPKGGLMDWLENIDAETVIREVYLVLKQEGITHEVVNYSSQHLI